MGEAKRQQLTNAFRLVLVGGQPVHYTSERSRCEPSCWLPRQIPDVDDARPAFCSSCGHPSKKGTSIVLHGHGQRMRTVVVLPATEDGYAEVGECWVRRFRCTKCKAVPSVLPRGVLPRYLYSALAIVSSFFMVAKHPVGDGLNQGEAYKRQGMYRRVRRLSVGSFRWRSIGRWVGLIPRWWPDQASFTLESLLVSFVERAGDVGRQEALGCAIASHVAWGAAM